MSARWARKETLRWLAANPYSEHGCRYCGSARQGPRDCDLAKCKACGSVTCSDAGMSGRCPVCLVGITDHWSGHDRPCGYKDCGGRAVAEAPRVRNVCASHALTARGPNGYGPGSGSTKRTVAECVQVRLEERARTWELVDLGART